MNKKLSVEEQVYPKMEAFLYKNGLQITLKTLIDSLESMSSKGNFSPESLLILEVLKGLHAGYLRRHEGE